MTAARNLAAAVAVASLGLVVAPAQAAKILPFAGTGVVIAAPCDPNQQDPAACFSLTSSNSGYEINGDPGWTLDFTGQLVPNPSNPFPFPTYVGAGSWLMSKGGDAFGGTWTNLFFPPPPPDGCDPANPVQPECFGAEGVAFLDYLVDPTLGAGTFAGLNGYGKSTLTVVTGFPPGNLGGADSTFGEQGFFRIPEPGSLALLALGLAGIAVARRGAQR